jgi:hypothetical protein
LVISTCAVALATPPADGYEISIYDAFPFYFWFMILLPILVPFLMLMQMHWHFSKGLWLVLYWNAAASLFLFLSLPLVRGYAFYNGGDSLSHLGIIKDLLLSGHIDSTNFYPIIHIWILALSSFSQNNPSTIMLYTPQFFTLFYAISMFLLTRVLEPKTALSKIVLALALVPIFGVYHICVFPSSEAFFVIPFAMYLLLRSRRSDSTNSLAFSTSFVLLMAILPFFHPETALFFLLIMIAVYCASRFSRRARSADKQLLRSLGRSTTPMLILVATLGIWFLVSVGFGGTIKAVYESFVLNLGQAPIGIYAESLSKAHASLVELLDLLIRMYGTSLVFIGIATISTTIVIVRITGKRDVAASDTLLSTLFSVLLPLSAVFMLRDLIIGERPMKYLMLISTVIVGSLTLSLSNRESRHRFWKPIGKLPYIVALAAVLSASTIAVFTTYPSPIDVQPNYQITQAEFSGMGFFFDYRNPNLQTMELTINQIRFKDALFGKEYYMPNLRYGNVTIPVSHFGYDTNSTLGAHYVQDQYLLFNALTKLLYPKVYGDFPNTWRFTSRDFQKLSNDSSTNLVFSNGDIELYLVLSENR